MPITNPSYSYLTYELKTQGLLGTANINSVGLVTYTPLSSSLGLDTVVVSVSNTQLNRSLDITYNFNIVSIPTPPSDYTISDRLLLLLENDVFMGSLSNLNIVPNNVCFDCNLYNNGYTHNNILIINPIKPTLLSILTDLINNLNSILYSSTTHSCSDFGFKAQVDRFLNIVLDLKNSINILICDINCCNFNLVSQLFGLLSQTIINLIDITTNIEGALNYCSSNCNTCYNSLDSFMSNIINKSTALASISNNWRFLTLSFMSCSNNSYKPYVASYVPSTK